MWGSFAEIEVWVDDGGAIRRLVFDGDIRRCSHPPRIYLDGAGERTLTVPLKPVVKGSPEAKKLFAAQEAQLAGLRKAQTLRCDGRDKLCRAQLVRRAGLVSDGVCGEKISAMESAAVGACREDKDCAIVSAAGGCLGVNGKVASLPLACGGAACRKATFDDHRIRCRDGCCLIDEE